MSFTVVAGTNAQYGSASSATTWALQTPSSTIPAGSFVMGCVCSNGGSVNLSTVADNSTQPGAANVWAFDTGITGSTFLLCVFYCVLTTRDILSSDTVLVTMASSASRRSGELNAWTPSNGNPALDSGGVAVSPVQTTSPVSTGAMSPLSRSDDLSVEMSGWRGGAVASGYSHSAPAGWTNGIHPTSAGTTSRVEAGLTWNNNVGSTTSFTDTAAFTTVNLCALVVRSVTDAPVAVTPKPKIIVVRNAWAGR